MRVILTLYLIIIKILYQFIFISNIYDLKFSCTDVFGEYSIFTNQSNKLSYRSLEFTTIYYITRENFIECLKNSEDDREVFANLANEVVFNKNLKDINL